MRIASSLARIRRASRRSGSQNFTVTFPVGEAPRRMTLDAAQFPEVWLPRNPCPENIDRNPKCKYIRLVSLTSRSSSGTGQLCQDFASRSSMLAVADRRPNGTISIVRDRAEEHFKEYDRRSLCHVFPCSFSFSQRHAPCLQPSCMSARRQSRTQLQGRERAMASDRETAG